MLHLTRQYAYKSTKNILYRNERILEIPHILNYIILYKWFFCKRKRI